MMRIISSIEGREVVKVLRPSASLLCLVIVNGVGGEDASWRFCSIRTRLRVSRLTRRGRHHVPLPGEQAYA